jgi:hypothetical protein
MSIWSFEKLFKSTGMGVGAIRFRRVACSATAANPAPPIASPSPAEKGPDSPRPDQQVRAAAFVVCL